MGPTQPPEAAPPPAGGQGAVEPAPQPSPGRRSSREPSGPRLGRVEVSEVLRTDVVTVERSTPIATVVAEMAEKDVGSVVVVEGEAPVGILTDREIALALETDPDVADRTAVDLLREDRDLVTGNTDMSVFDALRQLSDAQVRRLPIVDEDGSLRGIVTLDDVLVRLGTELETATSIIGAQSPRR